MVAPQLSLGQFLVATSLTLKVFTKVAVFKFIQFLLRAISRVRPNVTAAVFCVEQILKNRSDINLLSAPQARMGIELANAHKPDLILMDINMPEMDGITAMKKLQNYEETHDIPVIAISANAMESDIKKALNAGFKAYIIKPFDIPKFLMEIDRFLEPENSTLVGSTKSQ